MSCIFPVLFSFVPGGWTKFKIFKMTEKRFNICWPQFFYPVPFGAVTSGMSILDGCFVGGYSTELTGGLRGGSRFALPPEVGRSRSKMFVCTTVPGGRPLLFISGDTGRTSVVLVRLHSTRFWTFSESVEFGRLLFFQQQTAIITTAAKIMHAKMQPTIIHIFRPESSSEKRRTNLMKFLKLSWRFLFYKYFLDFYDTIWRIRLYTCTCTSAK